MPLVRLPYSARTHPLVTLNPPSSLMGRSQVNLLEAWVEAVRRRARGGRLSSSDLLVDPSCRAKQTHGEDLQRQLGLAVSEACTSADPEVRRRAKAKASMAMYQLSQKRRHFKGNRPLATAGTRF